MKDVFLVLIPAQETWLNLACLFEPGKSVLVKLGYYNFDLYKLPFYFFGTKVPYAGWSRLIARDALFSAYLSSPEQYCTGRGVGNRGENSVLSEEMPTPDS